MSNPRMAMMRWPALPQLTCVPAPMLTASQHGRITHLRRELQEHPHYYDGALRLISTRNTEERLKDEQRQLHVFDTGSYAWSQLATLCAKEGEAIPFVALGVNMILRTSIAGQPAAILQRRGAHIESGGQLTFSVAGYVDAYEHPRRAVLRELQEELGINELDLVNGLHEAGAVVMGERSPSGELFPVMVVALYEGIVDNAMPLATSDECQELLYVTRDGHDGVSPAELQSLESILGRPLI